MKKLKYYFCFLLIVSIVLAGCTNNEQNKQSITEMDAWKAEGISPEELKFYEKVSTVVEKVDQTENTAIVTVTMPDLEKYLQSGEISWINSQEIELEFPIQQVDGKWQISSMDPLMEYLREESTRFLLKMMEDSNGITIDFDPQEVIE